MLQNTVPFGDNVFKMIAMRKRTTAIPNIITIGFTPSYYRFFTIHFHFKPVLYLMP